MKIPLNMGNNGPQSERTAQARSIERDVLAAQKGDWQAKNSLASEFLPLLTSLAEKRASEPAKINEYVEAGKQGLFKAAKKYKPSIGADKFRIFALDYIEKAMNSAEKGGGFFSRLFGG